MYKTKVHRYLSINLYGQHTCLDIHDCLTNQIATNLKQVNFMYVGAGVA